LCSTNLFFYIYFAHTRGWPLLSAKRIENDKLPACHCTIKKYEETEFHARDVYEYGKGLYTNSVTTRGKIRQPELGKLNEQSQ
jgi:hypothetical protein